ncbi:UDP-N-acetylglucosamine 2-epimerase (hydrolyzing) [Paenibacillus sp. sptzw28]|uniref:UDP-N-acetylglucosamine 2-epimerase n=1 Tax=Paenibacillus sp. sptzw28 TaxID=715179 RepID=UPI001C6F29A5|nr:UDP-N-acetylglucosamine 2-epimerase [Paenibacillus sp. sptzw28]QYR19845.1 UDP-N-acetylglucosamine 2-epimerase (hydrolyzing) [Paenibacillus sp. sptzw28]
MKITVALVDRANYGRLKPIMTEMKDRPEIQLQVVCAGTMLLDRFGKAINVVAADGFNIDEEVYLEIDGSNPGTMTKSIGLGIIEFTSAFRRLSPDLVLLIGDRYEALAAAIAATYQNICLIHVQGGEVTGSIDEVTRHAITKMAHYHFPATQRSGNYIVRMGEEPHTVFPLGCPSADVVSNAPKTLTSDFLERSGVGAKIDITKPYLLVLFHPVTTEYAEAQSQMEELLQALKETGEPVILLWPNIDAGSDHISGAIRRFREYNPGVLLRAYKNFEPEIYIPLLTKAACAVGNSSSFIREASFLGTPVVLIGSRQDGRERCEAVIRVEPDKNDILQAIRFQLKHGQYPVSALYGSPGASKQIVDIIVTLKPYSQKRLIYIKET